MLGDILKRCSREIPPSSFKKSADHLAAPQLHAVSDFCDVFFLCEGNILKHANLSQSDDTPPSVSMILLASDDGKCEIPPEIDMRSLNFSPGNDQLLVWGDQYIAAISLPRRSHMGSLPANGSYILQDISYYVFEELHMIIADAAWHPLSDKGCVVVLAKAGKSKGGGGKLLLFSTPPPGISTENIKPEQELSIPPDPDGPLPVGIAFGAGPSVDDRWDQFAVYILMSSGAISVICPVIPCDGSVRKQGVHTLYRRTCEELDEMNERYKLEGGDSEIGALDEDDPFSKTLKELQRSIKLLEKEKDWLSNTFGKDIQVPGPSTLNASAWIEVHDKSYVIACPSLVQEKISPILESPLGALPNLGKACSLICLTSASRTSPGSDEYTRGGYTYSEGVLGGSIVLVRAFKSGHVDMIMVIGGASPRWPMECEESVQYFDYEAPVIECLNFFGNKKNEGFAPKLVMDDLQAWTFHVQLPHRIATVHVMWGRQLTQVTCEVIKELIEGDGDRQAREMLSMAIKKRPDSRVREHLCVLPKGGHTPSPPRSSGLHNIDAHAIIGVTVTRSPSVGHLLIARLACGVFELINLNASESRAEIENKLAVQRQSRKRPKTNIEPSGLLPFEQVAEECNERVRNTVAGHAYKLSGGDTRVQQHEVTDGLVRDILREKERLEEGAVDALDKLRIRMEHRMGALKDMHLYQLQQLEGLKEQVREIEQFGEKLTKKHVDIDARAQRCAARAAAVLEQAQIQQPMVTSAERTYHDELESWEAQCARWKGQVAQLDRSAEAQVNADEVLLKNSGWKGEKEGLDQSQQANMRRVLEEQRELLKKSIRALERLQTDLLVAKKPSQ